MNKPISSAAGVSSLRQRLIDDMNMRRFSPETQRNYIRDVRRFATFFGARARHGHGGESAPLPDRVARGWRSRADDEQHRLGAAVFFTHTLDRPDLARRLVRVTHSRKLPVVLSPDEVARLLSATTCLKHQAALSVAYGAGLRVAEVSGLKVSDIDSERMLLRIEHGKGGQYRNAMLSEDTALAAQPHGAARHAKPCGNGPAQSKVAPMRPGRHWYREQLLQRLARDNPAAADLDCGKSARDDPFARGLRRYAKQRGGFVSAKT